MKTNTTEAITNTTRDSLVFSFEDFESDSQPNPEKTLEDNNGFDESKSEILETSEEETLEVEKTEIRTSSTKVDENEITSLLLESNNVKDYTAKWNFILKNGYEAYLLTTKNKTL